MTITVRLFAVLREQVGTSALTLELPHDSTAGDAVHALAAQHPGIARMLPRVALSINQAYGPSETVLRDGDEVALIPPVSGG